MDDDPSYRSILAFQFLLTGSSKHCLLHEKGAWIGKSSFSIGFRKLTVTTRSRSNHSNRIIDFNWFNLLNSIWVQKSDLQFSSSSSKIASWIILSWIICPDDENSVRRRREHAGSYASSQPQRQAATKTHRVTQAGSRSHAATQACLGILQADRQAGKENAGKLLSNSWQNPCKTLV